MFTESWQFCEAKAAWMKKCRISAYIKIATALNRHKKAVNGSKILFLGVAYKPNIDDERESPALEIMDITARKGGVVSYNDPHIPRVQTHYSASIGESYLSVDLTAETLQNADCVVLTTNHNAFDLEFIKENAKLIVDMRNMIKESSDTVYKL
jgi:UDP-N-acetyl-D-glucosamine dehydrogenase